MTDYSEAFPTAPAANRTETSWHPTRLAKLVIGRIRHWLELRRTARADRKAIKALLSRTDRELFDIGVTRGMVLWAYKTSRPGQSATMRLQQIARNSQHKPIQRG